MKKEYAKPELGVEKFAQLEDIYTDQPVGNDNYQGCQQSGNWGNLHPNCGTRPSGF